MNHLSLDETISIESEFQWILTPIYEAFKVVEQGQFFTWLANLKSAKEFAPVATQIYFHSNSFPKAIGLMLSMIPASEGIYFKTIAEHAFDEADHHLLLLKWMVKHKIVNNKEEIMQSLPTVETDNCINIGYQIAMSRDVDMWLVCINCALEHCFYNFFKMVSVKMDELSSGDVYFDTHVDGDHVHSLIGLKLLDHKSFSDARKEQLTRKALDTISLWTAMVHSWIGLSEFPKFPTTGKIDRNVF